AGAPATLTINNAAASTLSATVTGNLNLTKTGAGTLTINTAETYTGATNVNAGTLVNGVANALPATTILTVAAGATYDLNGFNQTIAGLNGGGNVTNSSATAATLTINNTVAADFGGVVSGNLALTKGGTGTQTLSGATANTYTGATTVND